jgi:hypothetical protein
VAAVSSPLWPEEVTALLVVQVLLLGEVVSHGLVVVEVQSVSWSTMIIIFFHLRRCCLFV